MIDGVNKTYISWSEFGNHVNELISKFESHGFNKENINYVYGLPKGGLPLAVSLANKFNASLIVDIYNDVVDAVIQGENTIIICDDVADSGASLQELHEYINEIQEDIDNPAKIIYCTLYTKPRCEFEKLLFCVEHFQDNEWLVMPWEMDNDEPDKEYMNNGENSDSAHD